MAHALPGQLDHRPGRLQSRATATTLASALQARHPATALIIYPPFILSRNLGNIAPGRLLFAEQGATIWERDVRKYS